MKWPLTLGTYAQVSWSVTVNEALQSFADLLHYLHKDRPGYMGPESFELEGQDTTLKTSWTKATRILNTVAQ